MSRKIVLSQRLRDSAFFIVEPDGSMSKGKKKPKSGKLKVALGLPSYDGGLRQLDEAYRALRRPGAFVDTRHCLDAPLGGIPIRLAGALAGFLQVSEDFWRALPNARHCWSIVVSTSKLKTFGAEISAGDLAQGTVRSLAAVFASLRELGVADEIGLDLARDEFEIPGAVRRNAERNLPDKLSFALRSMARRNKADGISYGLEHAAPSHFGDVATPGGLDPTMRLTIGAVPEARFWAIRDVVCEAAMKAELEIVPRVAQISAASQRPWYYRHRSDSASEPTFRDFLNQSISESLAQLKAAGRPRAEKAENDRGGNIGIQGELSRTAKILQRGDINFAKIAAVANSAPKATSYLLGSDATLGPKLCRILERAGEVAS